VTRLFGAALAEANPLIVETIGRNLRLLQERDGTIVGRAAVANTGVAYEERVYFSVDGAITSGGLRAGEVNGIVGILTGQPVRAARDLAIPDVSPAELARWASEQALMIAKDPPPAERFESDASTIWRCGGDPGPLEVARDVERPLTVGELRDWSLKRTQIILCMDLWNIPDPKYGMHVLPDVLVVRGGLGTLVSTPGRQSVVWPPYRSPDHPGRWRYLMAGLSGCIVLEVAEAWGCDVEQLLAAAVREENGYTVGTLNGEEWTSDDVIILDRTKIV
jgi:hypothetical protein